MEVHLHVERLGRPSISQGRADIGLTIQPSPRARLVYRPLLSDEFGLVCRSDDELAEDGPLPWSVFKNRPFVAMASESSVRQMTDAAFLQARLAIPPLYGCAFLGTTGHLVAAGLGITALPRLTLPLMGQLGLVWRRLERPVMRRQISPFLSRHVAKARRERASQIVKGIETIDDELKVQLGGRFLPASFSFIVRNGNSSPR